MLQNIDTKKLKLLAQASKGIAQTCCEQERSGLRYSNENLSLLWRCAQDWANSFSFLVSIFCNIFVLVESFYHRFVQFFPEPVIFRCVGAGVR